VKENLANFTNGCKRHCMCEIQADPLSSFGSTIICVEHCMGFAELTNQNMFWTLNCAKVKLETLHSTVHPKVHETTTL
jgi:hypothetical protein